MTQIFLCRFDDAVKHFVSLVKSCLKVESEEAMLLAIQRRQLTFHCASFSRDELHILDACDRSKGLPHLKNRAAGYPERISQLSSIGQNIHSLLRYCHTRQPTKPLAVKVENIKSLPTFSVSPLSGKRTVQQNPVSKTHTVTCTAKKPSAALGAPVPSGSHLLRKLQCRSQCPLVLMVHHLLRKPQCRSQCPLVLALNHQLHPLGRLRCSCREPQTNPLSSCCRMRILSESFTWMLTAI